MLKNYLLIAYRNAIKNKTHSLINIFGLAIAFFCSLLLFLNASHELSYDTFFPDKERVFKLYHRIENADGEVFSTSMGYPVAPTVKSELPEIEASTRFMNGNSGIEYNCKKIDLALNFVDDDFFKVFSIPFLSGDKNTPLKDLGNIVLSENAALRIFNKENPIGKLLKVKVAGKWKDLAISAVTKDLPKNSSINFDLLARPELRGDYEATKTEWNTQHHNVYIKISSNSSKENVEAKLRYVLKKYNPGDTVQMKNDGYQRDVNGDYVSVKLLPLSDLHFSEKIGSGNNTISKTYIYGIFLISLFILAIACFNFINLNIARAFTRAKEVGVRKCLGANRKQIFLQICSESLIISTVALLIGIFLAILLFPSFNQVFAAHLNLKLFIQPYTLAILGLSLITITLLAGGYPAFVVSRLSTSNVLKGNVVMKKPGFFRNSLIVLQFSMACLLMTCTLIAYNQFEFMRTMPLGINQEGVISVPLNTVNSGHKYLNHFRNRLLSEPSVVSVSGSNVNIGLGKDGSTSKQSSGFGYKDKSIFTNWITVDYDFLKTLGIKPVLGRDFSREYGSDTISKVIVTESMLSQFGEKDALRISFSLDSARANYQIVGVIPDFHLYSAHEKKEPLTIDISQQQQIAYVFIKTNGKNTISLMNKLKSIYKELEPEKEFKASFMDENTDRWYNKEKRLSLLLGISSLVAIIISCMGLFALVLLIIQQRTKEIGVRKVLGSSVAGINYLLSKDFIRLVAVALIIAIPIGWWLMSNWLRQFPYQSTINWIIFFEVSIAAITVSILTISFHTIKAAHANPVKNLRTE